MKKCFIFMGLVLTGLHSQACSSSSKLTVTGSSTQAEVQAQVIKPVRAFSSEDEDGIPIGSPTSTIFKMYALYISENDDCSAPALVQDYGTEGVDKDIFEDGVTLFRGDPTDGTYRCLIIKMSDNIRFKANQAAVSATGSPCVADQEYTIDVYRTDSNDDWKDLNGNVTTARGASGSPVSDEVYIFVSRGSIPSNVAHANQSGTLGSDLIVPGQAIFYADATNQIVQTESNECGLNGLTMGFR